MQNKTVADVENVLEYLQSVAFQTEKGNREEFETGAHKYARDVLAAAEQPLRKLGMYEAAERAINESERLITAGQFKNADQLLLDVAREMMEKSGTNDRLRKLYAPKISKRKQ